MITFLDGKLVSALPTQATIDVGGVGYEVFIPLSSYDKLPAAGQPIRIRQPCQRHRAEAGARGVKWNERK